MISSLKGFHRNYAAEKENEWLCPCKLLKQKEKEDFIAPLWEAERR